jgi:glyoxylase-like metal-dependent hydrolase (beta-lactamase superfamily II)
MAATDAARPIHAMEIGPVTLWTGASHGKYPDGNQLRVAGRDSVAIFDTPLISLALDAELAAADLMILGHVHEDHMVGIGRFADRPLYVHEADVAAARSWAGLAAHYGYEQPALEPLREKVAQVFRCVDRPDAIAYADRAHWDLGRVRVEAIHMPGHTAGHCVLMIEPGSIAFIGDIDLSSFGPYYGDACSSLSAFRSTLKAMAALPARVWITSHHKGVIDSRERFLEQLAGFAARIEARETRLLQLLAAGPSSIGELAAAGVMYRPGSATEGWMICAERRCIDQHLRELLAAARVIEIEPSRFALR